ncbi:MAG: hypothetical protein IT338_15075 [Thermomicrobiales bacterium]|nr:hypothetical protein [Thermomicrobiales bacterium]
MSGIPSPTALAWLPPTEGSDLLVTGKRGILYRWSGGPATPIPKSLRDHLHRQ